VKYLALLKDSLREAVDTKVFFVMVALSTLVIVLVASLGFQPRPATDLTAELERTLNLDIASMVQVARGEKPSPPSREIQATFRVASLDAPEGAPDQPGATLHIVIQARFLNAKLAAEAKQAPGPAEQFIREKLASYGRDIRFLKVADIHLANAPPSAIHADLDPSNLHWDVTTQPTRFTRACWPHDTTVLFGAFKLPLDSPPPPVGTQVYLIEQVLVNFIGASVAILVSIIITGFFIPNMLRKGTVELLLVKPIRRWTLLIYKYLGGLTFIFLNTLYAIAGVWLVFGLRAGLWSTGLFLMVVITTCYFAILYAVSTLFSVLTRSSIVAILVSCAAWVFFFLVAQAHVAVDLYVKEGRIPYGWYVPAVNGLHYVLPRPKDLDRLASNALARDLAPQFAVVERQMNLAPVNWTESTTVSGAFIAVMLGLACYKFSTRDY
jgi:ABC-type transport system involved in multi-copper enzyme maturation permease subunit